LLAHQHRFVSCVAIHATQGGRHGRTTLKAAQGIIAAVARLFHWWFRQIGRQDTLRAKAVVVCVGLLALCVVCSVPVTLINGPSQPRAAVAVAPTAKPTIAELDELTSAPTAAPTETSAPTATAEPPTSTPLPSPTDEPPTAAPEPPTATAEPPTATPEPTAVPTAKPKPTAKPAPQQNLAARAGCDPSYPDVCIPPAPPDLDCRVLRPDPLGARFDRIGWLTPCSICRTTSGRERLRFGKAS
jgi:hypothetical protein